MTSLLGVVVSVLAKILDYWNTGFPKIPFFVFLKVGCKCSTAKGETVSVEISGAFSSKSVSIISGDVRMDERTAGFISLSSASGDILTIS